MHVAPVTGHRWFTGHEQGLTLKALRIARRACVVLGLMARPEGFEPPTY